MTGQVEPLAEWERDDAIEHLPGRSWCGGCGVDRGVRDDNACPVCHLRLRMWRERYPMGPSRLGVIGKAVHHIDGDSTNNDPSNLRIVNLSEHAATAPQPSPGGAK